MAKRVQLMTNPKQWQVVDGVEVLVDVPQEDIDPITDSSCVEIEGHRTLEETISQENMFTPEIVETKVHSKVGGVYHDNVVDGAYEEAILYGNTQVNLVESMTSGTKYIPHSFTSFQGNESEIGNYYSGRTNQVAPLVKGVTMVNLAQETNTTVLGGGAVQIYNVKGNTLYSLFFTFTAKNTNAGITIQSFKDETYLENTKIQTNLSDKVVMTFTTHEQTNKIHICNGTEFGGETIQLDNIMVIEGDVTDLDLPFFKGMRSVELSKPLTNLFTDDLRTESLLGGTATNSGGTVVATAESIGTWKGMAFFLDNKLKPNTKYLIMWDSLTQTQTSTTNTDVIIGAYHHDGDTTTTRLGKINDSPLCPVMRSIVFDTGNYDVTQISIRVHATLSNSETGITTITGLRVFEWDDSLRTLDLQTIGYFSGTKYVSARALETEGKNLYPYGDVNFTNDYVGWCDAKGKTGMYGDIAQKSSTRFLLKKGTYTFSIGSATNVELIYIVDDKEQQVGHLGQELKTFTLAQDTYCTIRAKTKEANVATTITNIQIERGETAITYEAYHSRYYKPRETEEIILRSLPNGVCDTFNLQTGELVQKIGEVILDGSENWTINATYKYFCNSIRSDHKSRSKGGMAISDKIIYLSSEQIVTNSIKGFSMGGSEFIQLCEPSCTTVNELKTYLQSNPITVQYELQEPVVRKITTYDRVYNGQTNALVNMGNNLSALSYIASNFYLKVANLSPVPSIIEPITSIPYDVRLKPSTLYTVKYNRGGNSNSMSFDLGGSVVEKTNATDLGIVVEELTVRTPAILSHEQIRLSGTGYAHNFIIVEGDITGTELPYFEGMKDVKMPIVKNISRNLLNESSMRVFYESNIVIRTYNVFPCKPNTRYCFISVGGETACNWHVCKKDAHYERPENESVGITQYLGYTREVVTPQDCYYMCIHTGSNPTTDREVYDIKTAIYEGSFAECVNYGYEDYKENSVYTVQGEYPITSEMMEQGGFSMSGSSDGSYENSKYAYTARLRSKELIPVKPNTTYVFAHSFSKFAYNVYQWNGNKKFIDGISQYFNSGQVETITTTADTQYIHFLMSKHNANETITVSEYDWNDFHMYELDSTINLRSLPNGVKDELNLLTGEYIQRVGEVVIDGSDDEDWKGLELTGDNLTNGNADTYISYGLLLKDLGKPTVNMTTSNVERYVIDNLNISSVYGDTCNQANIYTEMVCMHSNGRFYLRLRKDRFTSADLTGWKQWFKNAPLTVQYELAEPIISHVRLVSNNQEREVGVKLPNGVCNTYNPSTGITTVRVGVAEFDGSADEGWRAAQTDPSRFVCEILTDRKYYSSDVVKDCMLCDKIVVVSYSELYGTNGTDGAYGIAPYGGNVNIQMRLKDITTVEQLQQYLSQNPITVWYELNYPQIQPDIVLPNGVHDEYNPETGVYTKKVGFIEFDGSEDETWYEPFGLVNTTPTVYSTWTLESLPNVKRANAGDRIPGVCNSLKFHNGFLGESDFEMYFISETGRFNLNIERAKLSSGNSAGLNQYLSQNPIKLWYELATPITYQLTPYFGLPQPYAYEDGYLIHDSAYTETTLPPEFKYKLVANRTGQIVQNGRKLQEHTTRLSNLEALIIEATIESLFNRELQLFELELMDVQLIDLGE